MNNKLTCFKCHKDTAILTYEENRIYKVSCPCGCEYDFEHSSWKCAEEYHFKMLELYGEIDRADRMKAENAKLRELIDIALDALRKRGICGECKHYTPNHMEGLCADCYNDTAQSPCQREYQSDHWTWQHADKLKELGILQDEN